MVKVIYLEVAVQDLASIYKYISQDSIKYAKLEVQKIKAFAQSLKSQPLKRKTLSDDKQYRYQVGYF
jgi:plasmid stabilization system protein ParE